MNNQQFTILEAFIAEKERMGLLEVLMSLPPVPRVLSKGTLCIICDVLAGYYRRLILPEIQRAEPSRVEIYHQYRAITSDILGTLSSGTPLRVEVYL
jgi:hypothetical protein